MTHPTPAQLRAELARELYEERAAILEFCAGLPRAEAERLARIAHPAPDAPERAKSDCFTSPAVSRDVKLPHP